MHARTHYNSDYKSITFDFFVFSFNSCRSFTDLSRAHALFSLATSSVHNAFLIFKDVEVIELYVQDRRANFAADDYKLNMWQSVCSTWDYTSGLVQLWLDGKPTIRKFIGGSRIGTPIIILGQVIHEHYSLYNSRNVCRLLNFDSFDIRTQIVQHKNVFVTTLVITTGARFPWWGI